MSLNYRRISLAQGVTLSVSGLLFGLVALLIAPIVSSPSIKLLLLLVAWLCFWFFSHDLTHHLVGRAFGIEFEYYFIGRSAIRKLDLPIVAEVMRRIPILGLKINRSSLEKASPNERRWMLRSGALSSMILPWLILPTSYSIGPVWLGVFFTLLTVGSDLFTLYFSPKVGDFAAARAVKG